MSKDKPGISSSTKAVEHNRIRLRYLNQLRKLLIEKSTLEAMREALQEQLLKIQHEQRYAKEVLSCISRIPDLESADESLKNPFGHHSNSADRDVEFMDLDDPEI